MSGVRSLVDRPRPLLAAAQQVSRWVGLIGTLVTMAVGFGIMTAVQGDAVQGLLGLIPGLITQVVSVLSAFGVVRRAEPQVTPVIDPRDNAGRPLVSAA